MTGLLRGQRQSKTGLRSIPARHIIQPLLALQAFLKIGERELPSPLGIDRRLELFDVRETMRRFLAPAEVELRVSILAWVMSSVTHTFF